MAKRDENGLKVYERNYKGIDVVDGATDATSSVMEMAISTGRPSNYPCTEQGLLSFQNRTMDYMHELKERNKDLERPIIPDIESWCTYLGITRTTLFNYVRRGGQWSDYINWVKTAITATKKVAAFNYQMPAVLMIFDLKNNDGYTDKTEVVIDTPEQEHRARLESQLEESGLVWNEEKGQFEESEI